MSKSRPSSKITRRRLLQGVAGVALGGAAVALWEKDEADRVQLTKRKLYLPRWDADGFKIGFLSDGHLVSAHAADRIIQALTQLAAEKPDVICYGGDWMHGSTFEINRHVKRFAKELSELSMPVCAITGNHDYWIKNPHLLFEHLEATPNVHFLRNQSYDIDGVRILGIDDGIAGRDRHDTLGVGSDKNVIALFHEPDFVERVDSRISLMLSGHSHGGQVCLPMGIALHTPRGARKYIQGYYDDAKVPLYVSRGIGTIGVPYRVFCPPEITIFELYSDRSRES